MTLSIPNSCIKVILYLYVYIRGMLLHGMFVIVSAWGKSHLHSNYKAFTNRKGVTNSYFGHFTVHSTLLVAIHGDFVLESYPNQ